MRRNRERNEYQKKCIQKKPMVCLGDSRKVEEGKEQQINCAHKHDKIINDSQNVYNREEKKPLNSNRLLVIFHWNRHFFLTYIRSLFISLRRNVSTAMKRMHISGKHRELIMSLPFSVYCTRHSIRYWVDLLYQVMYFICFNSIIQLIQTIEN